MACSGYGELEFINSIMIKEVYLDIIRRKVHTSARKLGLSSRFIFQQDGEPKHTTKFLSKWFKDNKFKVLDWSTQSPDLNTIEKFVIETKGY